MSLDISITNITQEENHYTTVINIDYFHNPFLPPINRLGKISLPVVTGIRYRSNVPSGNNLSSP